MPTKRYLRDTQTEAGTTGTPSAIGAVCDLSTTQGSSATLASGNLAGAATYDTVPAKSFTQTVGAGVIADGTQNYNWSLDFSAASADMLFKVRLRRVNSSGTTQATSSFGTEYGTSPGTLTPPEIKTGTISFNAGTWASGDRLVLDVMGQDDGPGAQNFTLNVNDADSWVETVDVTPPDFFSAVADPEVLPDPRLTRVMDAGVDVRIVDISDDLYSDDISTPGPAFDGGIFQYQGVAFQHTPAPPAPDQTYQSLPQQNRINRREIAPQPSMPVVTDPELPIDWRPYEGQKVLRPMEWWRPKGSFTIVLGDADLVGNSLGWLRADPARKNAVPPRARQFTSVIQHTPAAAAFADLGWNLLSSVMQRRDPRRIVEHFFSMFDATAIPPFDTFGWDVDDPQFDTRNRLRWAHRAVVGARFDQNIDPIAPPPAPDFSGGIMEAAPTRKLHSLLVSQLPLHLVDPWVYKTLTILGDLITEATYQNDKTETSPTYAGTIEVNTEGST